MRKRIVRHGVQEVSPTDEQWLDVDRLAQVEITSQAAGHRSSQRCPGHRARVAGGNRRAANHGPPFDAPMRLSRIRLVFEEEQHVRARRSLRCGGHPTVVTLTGSWCASSTISVRRRRPGGGDDTVKLYLGDGTGN